MDETSQEFNLMNNKALTQTLNAIDQINITDPNTVMIDGETHPKEFIYGTQMSACLHQYWSEPSELIQIAVRAQHIKRWHLKRTDYALGKTGYMLWRKDQGKLHAQLTADLMQKNGYSAQDAAIVASVLKKEKLKSNPLTQTLEDVACLVFLQFYFADFATKHSEEKLVDIVQKTWRKMSDKAQNIALTFTLPNHLANIVKTA